MPASMPPMPAPPAGGAGVAHGPPEAPFPSSWLLLYDASCDLCSWTAWVVARLAPGREQEPGTPPAHESRGAPGAAVPRVEPLPIADAQRRGLGAALRPPATPEELEGSFHLVAPDRRRWSGADAVPALAELLGGGLVGRGFRWEPVRALTGAAYGWVTEHRHALSRLLPRAPPAVRRPAGAAERGGA